MTKNKIYFLRHGESESNVKGTFAGQKENSPLTEKGKAQARDAALDLTKKKIKPQKIYVSPLLRAYETAQIVIAEAGLTDTEIIIDERISEYDMGSLTGTPIREVTSHELISAKGAEEPGKFMDRVHNLIEEIEKINDHVLIVSHAGVGRIIEAKKKGIPAENFYDLDPYPNAQIIELVR